jgi:RES domain-containing protein
VKLLAYRISKAAYADTIWSGIGARDFGGRWNSKGVAVVYTAGNRSLAAVEQLVHLVKPRVLAGYVMASITFDDAKVQRIDPPDLPANWNDPVAPPELKRLGDDWVAAGRFAVLAVPSAVIPGEVNYLFNPAHREFHGFAKSEPEPFVYDSRLG